MQSVYDSLAYLSFMTAFVVPPCGAIGFVIFRRVWLLVAGLVIYPIVAICIAVILLSGAKIDGAGAKFDPWGELFVSSFAFGVGVGIALIIVLIGVGLRWLWGQLRAG